MPIDAREIARVALPRAPDMVSGLADECLDRHQAAHAGGRGAARERRRGRRRRPGKSERWAMAVDQHPRAPPHSASSLGRDIARRRSAQAAEGVAPGTSPAALPHVRRAMSLLLRNARAGPAAFPPPSASPGSGRDADGAQQPSIVVQSTVSIRADRSCAAPTAPGRRNSGSASPRPPAQMSASIA